jgi:hypothetical protein
LFSTNEINTIFVFWEVIYKENNIPALSRILPIKLIEILYIDNTSYLLRVIIPVLYTQKLIINILEIPRVLTLSN